MTNARTLTLAGETMTDEDFPIGTDWYEPACEWEQNEAGIRGAFRILPRFGMDTLYCAVFWIRDDAPECAVRREHRILLPWIADRCRCWFLDQADAEYQKMLRETPDHSTVIESEAWQQAIISAAKWARIGRSAMK